MGPNAFREIYDEDLDGVADADLVAMDLKQAHAQVAARIRQPSNGGLPTDDEDGVIQLAVLAYSKGFAYQRHAEYRKNVQDCKAEGKALCEDIRSGKAMPKAEAPVPEPSMGGSSPSSLESTLPTFVRESSGRQGCGCG